MDFLDNATLWVGISFIIFVLLILKPVLKGSKTGLDNNINVIKDIPTHNVALSRKSIYFNLLILIY
jgi:F0F1-type ATP synthase membrane subunit b/b'